MLLNSEIALESSYDILILPGVTLALVLPVAYEASVALSCTENIKLSVTVDAAKLAYAGTVSVLPFKALSLIRLSTSELSSIDPEPTVDSADHAKNTSDSLILGELMNIPLDRPPGTSLFVFSVSFGLSSIPVDV